MQDCVTDWQSPVIPPTIRRPWRVFEEDLEEKVTNSASQIGQADPEVREQIAAVQAKGARVAFLSLSESARQTYYQVALSELSAFVFWRRSQLARQKAGEILPTDLEAGWDLLDPNDKGEWLPQDPIAFLRADAQWATLLADVQGGEERAPGTEELGVPTPMKSEILTRTPGDKAPVKCEPSAPITAKSGSQAAARPVKKEPAAPATHSDAPKAGVPQPPGPLVPQEAAFAAPPAEKAAPQAPTDKESEKQKQGSMSPPRAIPPQGAEEKKAPEVAPKAPEVQAKAVPEPTRRSRRVNASAGGGKEVAGGDLTRAGRAATKRARSRPAAAPPQRPPGSRHPREDRLDKAPANLFPEVLEATCCKCKEGHASMENDLAMCDRCDRAFHAKCHEPPVAYFGRPDDQWFCAACTTELAEMRELSLKVDDFCWVQCTGEAHPWPAQVLRIDFCSLADPRPYWVQYFDAGSPEGQWVGEVNVKPWTGGPRWGSIAQARRRNAVRLAEAAGAPCLSTMGPAPKTPKRKAPAPLEGDSPKSPVKKRQRPNKDPIPAGKAPRRSSRVQANVDRKAVDEGGEGPSSRKAPRLSRRMQEKKDVEDDEFVQQANEMRSLIAAAKERQRKLEAELVQVANAKQVVLA
ncbi:phf1 [Symbiodinium natans]|uniref:Phf1 protein n=1 Tax=Symbiodinium natans TaxID=878477 RepID=A0A812MRT7_9DINO|nr:phf1 [Symbiodinium natans]